MKTEFKDQRAIRRLAERIAKDTKPIDNGALPAGSPMYFYCRLCKVQCDVKSESYMTPPKKYCDDCRDLKETSGLTDTTLVDMAKEVTVD